MFLDITAIDLQGSSKDIRVEDIPDFCPVCHMGVHPKYVNSAFLKELSRVQVIFRCTRQHCQELFIGTYLQTERTHAGRVVYILNKLAPMTAIKEPFPNTISDISPTFIDIFNQSIAAEAANLSQLVGIGLRKALEFLVKDFAIAQSEDNEEDIKKAFLGTCIDRYIDDVNVKECAKRAAWLGNDETHYIRKWEEKDINDLKLLVRLTVNWIDNVLLTKKYTEEMSEGST